jgi:hypothetical protein
MNSAPSRPQKGFLWRDILQRVAAGGEAAGAEGDWCHRREALQEERDKDSQSEGRLLRKWEQRVSSKKPWAWWEGRQWVRPQCSKVGQGQAVPKGKQVESVRGIHNACLYGRGGGEQDSGPPSGQRWSLSTPLEPGSPTPQHRSLWLQLRAGREATLSEIY